MLNDSKARQMAMELQSKLIKAPAGSGKTAILTNYCLKLLGLVEHPREIQALTFTNKASQEMKSRIIESIARVKKGFKPTNDYETENYQLAKKALLNSQERGWNIEKNSNMLNIGTIDSFCKRVLIDHVGAEQLATRNVAKDPKSLYSKAVNETLSLYSDPKHGQAIQSLTSHFGNKMSKVEKLLVEMIETRERWIPVLFVDKESARADLESKRAEFLNQTLGGHFESLSNKESELQEVISKLEIENPSLLAFVENGFSRELEDNRDIFIYIKKILCSSANKPKLRFTKNDGISKLLSKDEKALLIDELQSLSKICTADLVALSSLPESKFKESEWKLLQAVFKVMPVVLAKLSLTFKDAGEVDFTEIALNAVRALDSESDDVTSNAINSSQTIRHILVDEFQDSNDTQLVMLRLLTESWAVDDGNTLFLVGDAMQSLYGFRGANVNVFMEAEEGIGNVELKTLELTTNFRSTVGVVDWVNNVFSQAFPKSNDLLLSASKYNESTAVKLDSSSEVPVEVHGFIDDNDGHQEASYIIDQIERIQANEPNASIAVLGRTRSALKSVIGLLNENETVNATAVNVNRIDKEPLCILAIALSRVLIDDMDKLAWLTLLNSGLFGLTHKKIEAIFNLDSDPYLAINDERVFDILSVTERERYSYVMHELNMAIDGKHNSEFDLLLEGLWYKLHGPSLAKKEVDLTNVESVFSLFRDMQSTELSLKWLERQLESLYAESKEQINDTTTNVELMTIHSAKGLEFDYVFIPSMHKKGLNSNSRLFSWSTTGAFGEIGVMACSEEFGLKANDTDYHKFLGRFNGKREEQELKRVVYVGVTRAIKKAYLTGKVSVTDEKDAKPPVRGSMFDVINPAFNAELVLHEAESTIKEKQAYVPVFSVIDANLQLTLPRRDTLAAYRGSTHTVENPNGVEWHKPVSKIEGVVVHKVIEQISKEGIEQWNEAKLNSYSRVILSSLKELSLERDLLITSVKNVKDEIGRLLNCDTFKSLCNKHKQDSSELMMSIRKNRRIQTIVIDKGYVTDDGVGHIVDWKSAAIKEGQSFDNFINTQMSQHKAKLKLYSEAYKQVSGVSNIDMSLYFTKTNQLELCS